MGTADSLRVGDSEREAVAAELREHYAQGRLTLEDFERRLDAAFAATTRADLDKVISDLPHTAPAGRPLPAPPPGSWRQHGRGSGWSGERRGRAALARISALLAALVSCLIVFDFMAGLRFPLPGRLGILLAIFALVRGLLRKIFGLGRRFF